MQSNHLQLMEVNQKYFFKLFETIGFSKQDSQVDADTIGIAGLVASIG